MVYNLTYYHIEADMLPIKLEVAKIWSAAFNVAK